MCPQCQGNVQHNAGEPLKASVMQCDFTSTSILETLLGKEEGGKKVLTLLKKTHAQEEVCLA